MPNFQQSKIYSIRSHSRPDLIYIGSTTQPLSKRMVQHREARSKCSSKEIIAIGDAYIELIENFPCNDKYELNARENRHMRAIENVVNKHSAQDDCPHGKKQNKCIPCGGSSMCIHGREQNQCIDCGGSGICAHNKRRNTCKNCNGTQICEHQRRRADCKACSGSAICQHQRMRRDCNECSPIECDFCSETHSKGTYKQHLKSLKHKKKYVAEFKRVFEANMNIEDVPEY